MTLPSLLPLAGAALVPALERVIDGVTEGLSFLDVLHKQAPLEKSSDAEAIDAKALQQDFVQLAEQLREKFAQFGIDLSAPVRLKHDGRNRIVVDGDHPERVLIESIIGNDEELTSLFNNVAAAASEREQQNDSGITRDFRFVLGQADALIDFE